MTAKKHNESRVTVYISTPIRKQLERFMEVNAQEAFARSRSKCVAHLIDEATKEFAEPDNSTHNVNQLL